MTFCKTIDCIIGTHRRRKLWDNYKFSIYEKAATLPDEDWAAANGQHNFFLTKNYLHTLEILQEDSMQFRYVLVFKEGKPVFAAYFQVNDFTADLFGDLMQEQLKNIQSHRAKLFEKYLDHQKNNVVMRLVTAGNNFVSGEHAFSYSRGINKTEAFSILEHVLELSGKALRLRGKISAILVKDFHKRTVSAHGLQDDKYIDFEVEPNMKVKIPEGTGNLNDYVATFSKKYRNRAKAIFKCGVDVERRELTLKEIQKHNATIYHLYEQVFEKAKFKLVKVSYDYFTEMKKRLDDNFVVTGYFKGNQMVAFSSAYVLQDYIEAHLIGFDYEMNKELECYQNLLYDFIDMTIKKGKHSLQLGRTASEIKSTVGAKAEPLICYIHPQNTVSKLVLSPFISFLQPSSWIPRNPFKEEEVALA